MKGIMQEFMNVYIEYIDFLLAAFIAILPVNIFLRGSSCRKNRYNDLVL